MQHTLPNPAKLADLLARIGASNGRPSRNDCAMASIYASAMTMPAPPRTDRERRAGDRRRT